MFQEQAFSIKLTRGGSQARQRASLSEAGAAMRLISERAASSFLQIGLPEARSELKGSYRYCYGGFRV